MRKTLFVTIVALVAAVGVQAATLTVAQDGSGDATSVMAAIGAATNGDEIIIADSAVYEEDVMAGAGWALVGLDLPGSFTLKAADGQTPTIRAANNSERAGFLGIPGIDLMGAMFLGCQGVLIEGITFESTSDAFNAANIASVVTLFDCAQFTIRNCTVRGAGGDIDYPEDNLGLAIAGIGAILPPTEILIEDCLVEETNIGIVVSKFPDNSVLGDPSVTIRGCTVQHCDGTGIEVDTGAYPESPNPETTLSGPGNLFEDNMLVDTNGGISFGGGYNIARNCTIIDSRGTGIDYDIDERGAEPITGIVENCTVLNAASDGLRTDDNNLDTIIATLTDCAFVGCSGDGARIDNGQVTLTRCIFAGNVGYGIHVREDGGAVTALADHCDIYENRVGAPTDAPRHEVLVEPGTTALLQLTITNSNIVGADGILNGLPEDPTFFDEEGSYAQYTNVFAAGEAYTNVITENERSADPMYIAASGDPDTFTREGFKLNPASEAAALDENGGPIGSQGVGTVDVQSWQLF